MSHCRFVLGIGIPEIKTLVETLFITGQSYEIRMLDNRKIGELPEITGKMVKVRTTHLTQTLQCFCTHSWVSGSASGLHVYPYLILCKT